jgi:hypothetical protein
MNHPEKSGAAATTPRPIDNNHQKGPGDLNKPVTLCASETDRLISTFHPRSRQIRRFIEFLSTGEKVTSACNQHVLSVNLSDLAIKYRAHLGGFGLEIRCRQPKQTIKNRLGEPSGQQYWAMYRLPECAFQRAGGGARG